MRTMLRRHLLFSIIMLWGACSIGAQEYWSAWVHSSDADSFDGPAKSFTPLAAVVARNSANYFVVERNVRGQPLEAVQVLGGKANYRYRYYYDDAGRIILRKMDFFNGSEMQLVSEVVWSHDSTGRLLSSAYYTFPAFGAAMGTRTLRVIKVYSGDNYVIHERPSGEDPAMAALMRRLASMQSSLDHLEKLEGRNLLQKILGMGK